MTADLDALLRAVAAPEALDEVLDLLQRTWAGHPDVDALDRMRFEIAVTEVTGNIVEHAAEGDLLEFDLRLAVHHDRLEAHFTDAGRPDDADPGAAELPDELAESGRGLALARRAVDELVYRREDGVNHWLVLRRRSAA